MSFIITVCIVNYNTSEFVLNTLYCLNKLTKNNYKVIIRDNNSKIKDFLNLKNNIDEFSNIELFRVEDFKYTGSMAHAIAINELINKIDTKYGVILDADCTFLHDNWDNILINEIDEKCPIIGTQAPNTPNSKKFKDFPLMFALFFNTDILKKLNVDFKPTNIKDAKDTGYNLRDTYLENGYEGKIINFRSTRTYKMGPFREVICGEYYLEGYDKIFASHFGRGSSLGATKYLKSWKKKFYRIPKIGTYFLKLKGKREKKKWIKICQELVHNQLI